MPAITQAELDASFIHYMRQRPFTEAAKVLAAEALNHGANINVPCSTPGRTGENDMYNYGCSLLAQMTSSVGAMRENMEAIRFLIDHGANVNDYGMEYRFGTILEQVLAEKQRYREHLGGEEFAVIEKQQARDGLSICTKVEGMLRSRNAHTLAEMGVTQDSPAKTSDPQYKAYIAHVVAIDEYLVEYHNGTDTPLIWTAEDQCQKDVSAAPVKVDEKLAAAKRQYETAQSAPASGGGEEPGANPNGHLPRVGNRSATLTR